MRVKHLRRSVGEEPRRGRESGGPESGAVLGTGGEATGRRAKYLLLPGEAGPSQPAFPATANSLWPRPLPECTSI